MPEEDMADLGMLEAPGIEGPLGLEEPSAAGPELVFALVGASGTDLGMVTEVLQECLRRVDYRSTVFRLSDALHGLRTFEDLKLAPHDERVVSHMNAGDRLRKTLRRGDALAVLGMARVRAERRAVAGNANVTFSRHAFIFRSLKHREEVATLRRVYGSSFYVISAYSPRERRIETLSRQIAHSNQSFQSADHRARAEEIVQRDYSDPTSRFGQDVSNTFPLADAFVNASSRQEVKPDIERFIEVLFGHPFHTPSRAEFAMFHARAAALRSSDLGRQVGAVIANDDGEIISIGSNEVPKAGGGQYWEGDLADRRNFTFSQDPSDEYKSMVLADILRRLKDKNWLSSEHSLMSPEELVSEAMAPDGPAKGAHLMNAIEYMRAVHAEMAAILEAARRGIAVKGCTIYTSTFPCHECAKHIVAAGLRNAVYIDPYAKSLAYELYPDSVSVDGSGSSEAHVVFAPFVGISPRLYLELFEMGERKQPDGRTVAWEPVSSSPRRYGSAGVYVVKEGEEVLRFEEQLAENDLVKVEQG